MATAPDRQWQRAGRAVLTQTMETAIREETTQFFLMASGADKPLYGALGYQTYESPEYWQVNPLPEG